MRYLTAEAVYAVHATLRRVYAGRGEGRTFEPAWPDTEVMARLKSAAARPQAEYAGQAAHSTLFQKTAALGHAIAQGHCFGNGNKRTAFFAINYVLRMNGWALEMPDAVVAFMMLRVASNQNRMSVENMAYIIGAFSYIPDDTQLRTLRYLSSDAIRRKAITVDSPDQFPSPHPRGTRKHYQDKAQEIIDAQYGSMAPEERDLAQPGKVCKSGASRIA